MIVIPCHCIGMAPVECSSSYKIYLNDYHDSSDYYVFQGVHTRFTSRYKPGPSSEPVIVPDHGKIQGQKQLVNYLRACWFDNVKETHLTTMIVSLP